MSGTRHRLSAEPYNQQHTMGRSASGSLPYNFPARVIFQNTRLEVVHQPDADRFNRTNFFLWLPACACIVISASESACAQPDTHVRKRVCLMARNLYRATACVSTSACSRIESETELLTVFCTQCDILDSETLVWVVNSSDTFFYSWMY